MTDIPDVWVEAAAKAMSKYADLQVARAALSAVLPLIERALKAEALREAADTPFAKEAAAVWDDTDPATGDHVVCHQTTAIWLKRRADALEEEV